MTTESTLTATFESRVNEKINEATSEGERMLARAWKMIAANGVAAILFGFVLLLWPDIGLTTIVAVVAGRKVRVFVRSRGVHRAARGRRSSVAAAQRRSEPGSASRCSSGTTSPRRRRYVVAAWAIAIGVLMLAAAVQPSERWAKNRARSQRARRRAFGAVMFIEPDVGAVATSRSSQPSSSSSASCTLAAFRSCGIAVDVRSRIPRPSTESPWRTADECEAAT